MLYAWWFPRWSSVLESGRVLALLLGPWRPCIFSHCSHHQKLRRFWRPFGPIFLGYQYQTHLKSDQLKRIIRLESHPVTKAPLCQIQDHGVWLWRIPRHSNVCICTHPHTHTHTHSLSLSIYVYIYIYIYIHIYIYIYVYIYIYIYIHIPIPCAPGCHANHGSHIGTHLYGSGQLFGVPSVAAVAAVHLQFPGGVPRLSSLSARRGRSLRLT